MSALRRTIDLASQSCVLARRGLFFLRRWWNGRNRKQKFFIFIAALFVVDMTMGLGWWSWNAERRFDPQILEAARRYEINPALVKAVVWNESRFDPNAVGKVGEIGLMQIRELTATEWAGENRVRGFTTQHLFNPQTNIFVGAWYLKKLLTRYASTDNPLPYALCDYNAGRRKVLEWMSSGAAITNSTVFLENVTYPTTREYVERVTRRLHVYEKTPWKRSRVL